MRKEFKFIVLLSSLIFGVSCSKGDIQLPLYGSWIVKEIHWITPDTTFSIKNSQPGYLMVRPKRYAFMWTPTTKPRIPFKNLSRPTDSEILQGFRSVVFNSGSYQIKDSLFKVEAEIAKVPGFEGGKQVFAYNIEGDQLILKMIDETYPNGAKPEWFGKLETKFVLKRLKEN